MEPCEIFREACCCQKGDRADCRQKQPHAPLQCTQKYADLSAPEQEQPCKGGGPEPLCAQTFRCQKQLFHIVHMTFFLFVKKFLYPAVDRYLDIEVLPVAPQIVHHFLRYIKQAVHFHRHMPQYIIFPVFFFKIPIIPVHYGFHSGNQYGTHQAECRKQPCGVVKQFHRVLRIFPSGEIIKSAGWGRRRCVRSRQLPVP